MPADNPAHPRLSNRTAFLIMALMVGLAVISRLMIDVPNFKPVAALALLAGMLFADRRLAIAVPLITMISTDLIFGCPEWLVTLSVYTALTINVLLGGWLGGVWSRSRHLHSHLMAAGCATLAGTLQFFLLTNLMVWLGTGWYPLTLEGLTSCFVNALPFLRFSLAADLLFGLLPLSAVAGVLAWSKAHATSVEQPELSC